MKELYDTPIRVFGKLQGSSLQFCDYMFQDEKIEEVTERIRELLDITVTEDDLDLTCERVATEVDWATAKQQATDPDQESVQRTSGLRDLGLRIGKCSNNCYCRGMHVLSLFDSLINLLFRTFLCHLARYWHQIWGMNLYWHNTEIFHFCIVSCILSGVMPLWNLLGPVGDLHCFSNTYMLVFFNANEIQIRLYPADKRNG